MFDERVARHDLRRFRRRGPAGTTRVLVDALRAEGVEDAHVLDVGGGVGAVAFTLLDAGARQATLVDAARAYLDAAGDEASRRGVSDRFTARHGDFVEHAGVLPDADVTTLDRALCCYPDLANLVAASTARTRRVYGVVYPRGTPWTRAGIAVVNALLRLRGLGMRVFVHDPRAVQRHIRAAGFAQCFARAGLLWRVEVYRRVGASS